MHEIWLVLNIVHEIALSVWPLLAVVLVVWLGLRWAARARLGQRGVERQAVLVGALLALALFFTVPILTQSSLSNRGYWVDWANHGGHGAGTGDGSRYFCLVAADAAAQGHCGAHGLSRGAAAAQQGCGILQGLFVSKAKETFPCKSPAPEPWCPPLPRWRCRPPPWPRPAHSSPCRKCAPACGSTTSR